MPSESSLHGIFIHTRCITLHLAAAAVTCLHILEGADHGGKSQHNTNKSHTSAEWRVYGVPDNSTCLRCRYYNCDIACLLAGHLSRTGIRGSWHVLMCSVLSQQQAAFNSRARKTVLTHFKAHHEATRSRVTRYSTRHSSSLPLS